MKPVVVVIVLLIFNWVKCCYEDLDQV